MQLLPDRFVSWLSKKQKSTAISGTEAEYIALVSTGKHLHQAFRTRTTGISHQKAWNAKHVPGDSKKAGRRRGRVMVEQVENGVVELYFVITECQLENIFTKPLAREPLEFLIKKLGMQSMSLETLKKPADEEEE
ncbi:hypothetical protein Tco_0635364 [Tanacetum coccineum]